MKLVNDCASRYGYCAPDLPSFDELCGRLTDDIRWPHNQAINMLRGAVKNSVG